LEGHDQLRAGQCAGQSLYGRKTRGPRDELPAQERPLPISYKKVCRLTGEEVPFKDIVKGYEYRDGDFVVLKDEDFEKADVKRTSAIEIGVFVDEKDVDPKYIEKPYYLEPQKKAGTAYALFREAMPGRRKSASAVSSSVTASISSCSSRRAGLSS
jgi:Ku protein